MISACLLLTPAITLAQGGRYSGSTESQQLFIEGQEDSSDGDEYLEDGEADRAQDAYEDAEEHYRESLEIDPDYEDARERLAYVLYVMGRSEDAVETLEEGLEENPSSIPLRRMLGINLYQLERTDDAMEILQAVDDADGATAEVLFLMAVHHYGSRDYENAITYFQRYLAEEPADTDTHGALGNAYLRTEQYELALTEFRTVLELDPGNLRAQINMGDVYFAQDQFSRAIEVYLIVIPDASDNHRVWFNLGSSQFRLDNFENALVSFEELQRLRDDVYQGHYFGGSCLFELGRFQEARDSLHRATELNDDHAMSHYRLGLSDLALGNHSHAVEALRRARAIDSDEVWYAWALGDALRETGDVDEAIELHEMAVSGDDSEAQFHESLGRDHFAVDDMASAIESLEQALLLDPSNSASDVLTIALLTESQRTLQNDDFESTSEMLSRAEELAVYPLQVGVALATVALMQDDVEAAQTALAAVPVDQQTALSYRRAAAWVAVENDSAETVASLLSDRSDTAADELEPVDAALLAHSAAEADEWRRALELFERANSGNGDYRTEMGICHIRLGIRAGDRDRWNESDDHFDEANALRDHLSAEDTVRVEYGRGVAALHLENYGAAERYFNSVHDRIRRLDDGQRRRLPRSSNMNLEIRLAYAQYRSGHYDDAIELLNDYDPSDEQRQNVEDLVASAHERLSREAFEEGDLRSARRHLEEAIESAPSNSIARNNLGALLYSEGETRDAGRIFRELADDGSVTNAIFNYAIFLDEVEEEAQEAYRYYRRYVEAGGEAADQARDFARTKEEVFGFEPDG